MIRLGRLQGRPGGQRDPTTLADVRWDLARDGKNFRLPSRKFTLELGKQLVRAPKGARR